MSTQAGRLVSKGEVTLLPRLPFAVQQDDEERRAMPREPQQPPRLLGWKKGERCSCSAGVSLSITSVLPPRLSLCTGGVGLAKVRDEVHQQRLVKVRLAYASARAAP